MLAAAPVILSLLFLGATANLTASTPPPPATAPVGAATTMPAPAFAAMGYYDQNCAHCHGPQGAFYGPTLGNDLTDAQLLKAVNDMASGAGNAPVTPDQLKAETAFHRSLIMRNPFLSVTQTGADGKWTGESMPDAKVVILIGQKRFAATMDDWNWSAQLPAGTNASEVKITAELNGVTTTLAPNAASYSNTTPIPSLAQRPK
jgi:hypothetical protein